MKIAFAVSLLFLIMVGLSCASFAATEYVVTNDDYVFANSASVYELNTTTGVLKLVTVLETGGLGMPQGFVQNNVLDVEQAISPNAACVFVLDPMSNDIASFSKALGYAEVGRYSNSALNSNYNGGSLALTPNAKFMYVSYSGSQNLGAWTANPDCSLTFIAAYVPSVGPGFFSTLRVSPNSSYLVVPYGAASELFTVDQNSGVLTDIGFVSYAGLTTCRSYPACIPEGIDFTRDSKIVIFGNGAYYPSAMTAEITPSGLVHPRAWSLPNPQRLVAAEYPFLSAAGYAGSGSLYFGASETDPPKQYHPGILTTNFTEEPLSITFTNGTVITPPYMIDCAIAVTGDLIVIAQPYNQIAVFKINPDGTVTQLSTTTDSHAGTLFSLSVFPNTR
jgi:hypothetical protein